MIAVAFLSSSAQEIKGSFVVSECIRERERERVTGGVGSTYVPLDFLNFC